ncbi:MAG: putative GNAT family N-acyltransferase [Polyangiales bacterium]|jgi:predicted GNAT family N-acyltransferase
MSAPEAVIKEVGASEWQVVVALRRLVFIDEQGVTEEEEFDEFDAAAIHLLATIGDTPVGTLRIRHLDDGESRIERVAVLLSRRGTGVGRLLMMAAIRTVEDAGQREITLAGQIQAEGFYVACGFLAEGTVFSQERIEHRWMRRTITP